MVSKSSAVLPYAWVILAVVYLASIVAPLNQFKVPPIMPVLMMELHITLTQAGSLMSVMAVIGLILALPAGIILQRVGSRTTGLLALGCMAAGAGMGALSARYDVLMVSRVIEGAGVGLIGVAAPATIALWFPPARQGAPMGIWATWVPFGTLTVYILAPLLTASLGWQAVWWVGSGFALVMMVFYGALVRRPPAQPLADPDESEQSTLRHALANRSIWLLATEFACFSLTLVGMGTYYPTFLSEVRHYPLGQAAFISSITSMMVLISAPLAGTISDRIGSRRLVFSLPFLPIALLLIFPFRVAGWQIIAILVAQGLLAGGIPTATFVAASEVMRKPQWAGLGLAVVMIGQNLGLLIGPVLFGQLVRSMGWAAAGYLMIPVCLLGFLCGWMVKVR